MSIETWFQIKQTRTKQEYRLALMVNGGDTSERK